MQSPRKIKFITYDPKKAGQAGQPYISTSAMDARYADPPATAMGGAAPTGEASKTNISYIKEYFFTGADAEKIIKYITAENPNKDVIKFITDNFGKQSFSSHKLKEINTSVDEVLETDTHVITYNEQSKYVFVYRKDKPLINEASKSIITEAEGDEKELDAKLDKPGYIPSPSDVELAAKLEEPTEEDEKAEGEAEDEPKPEEEADVPSPEAEDEKPEESEEPEEKPEAVEAEKPETPPVEVSKVFKKGDTVYFISKNKEKIRGKIEELVTTQADSWYNFVSDDGEVDLWTKANTFNHISSAIVKPATSQT